MKEQVPEKVLNECGFSLSIHRTHADEYKNKSIVIYTDDTNCMNLIINPEDYAFLKDYCSKKRFNSNLNKYPKEINEGKKPTNYGYKIVFEDSLSMKRFLTEYIKYKVK